jgi:hypothetical protein
MNRRPHLVPIFAAIVVVIWTAWLLSCSKDKSTEPVKLVYRVHDALLKTGYYCLCWNQHDQRGEQVTAGSYQVHIVASNFDTTIGFTIATNSSSVVAPLCCDTMTVAALKPSKDPPDRFSLSLNAGSYSTGDSIAVDFALPVSCKCVIDMEQR